MDIRQVKKEYEKIANGLINSEPLLKHIKDSKARIIYLESEHPKKTRTKIIFAECEKIPEKYKWAIDADFTITVFEPNIEGFTKEQLKILLFHELLHVGISTDNLGLESYYIEPHDLEDFREIIRKYGVDWEK